MSTFVLNARVEQVQAVLSRLVQEQDTLSPACQEQIAAEFDRFSHRLSHLLSNNTDGLPMQYTTIQPVDHQPEEDPFYSYGNQVGMVLRSAFAGIFVRDFQRNISIWSPELRALVDLAPDEPASTEKFYEMVYPDDREIVQAWIRSAIEKGGPFYTEFRLNRGDGETIWMSATGYVEQDASGRPLSITGINQDITRRKQMELELQESEAALRQSEEEARLRLAEIETLYENAPVGLCVLDTHFRWVRINQRLAEMNGFPIEAHIGKTPQEMLPGMDQQGEVAFQHILETGEPLLDFEIRGFTSTQPGVEHTWNERWTPIKNELGEITGISVAAEDITERRRAEAERDRLLMEIASERKQLNGILDQMPVGVIIAEAPSGKILFQNQRVREWLLRSHDSQSVEDYGPWNPHYPDGTPYPLENVPMARTVRHGEAVHGEEMMFQAAHGDWLTFSVNSTPIYDEKENVILGVLTLEDITERRKTQEALRHSEAKFHGAFANASIGFAMVDPHGHFVDANPAYCKLTGYTINELHNYAFEQLIHPDDRVENLRMNEKLDSGEIADYVIRNRYIRKDGQTVYVRKSISGVRNEKGEPQWHIALVEDISERLMAERALEKTHIELVNERNRLLTVMEALPVGLAIYDEKGGVLQANQGFEGVWGSPRPPANSVDDYDLYKAWWVESGQRVQPDEWAAARAVQHGETVTGQYMRIQKFDGTQGYVLNSGAPVRDAQGQLIGAVVTIMDITDRVRTEIALQENQERFRVALTNVPIVVYTCDRALRYNWVYNPLGGFRTKDVLGKRDDELMPPEAVTELIAAKQAVLDSGQGSVQEIRLSGASGVNYYILTAEPIKDSRRRVTGLTCSAIDITEQRQLELERKESEMRMEVQSRLMEYREKERQEIARDLHDGPIQLISGTIFHLQVAKEGLHDPLMRLELEQASLNLKSAVRDLRNTMNELLPPAVIRFGLAKTARMYAEDFREKHPEIQIKLHLFDDDRMIPEPARLALFRIYQESLNNIFKHAGASRVWVRLTNKGSQVELQIRDNGSGFQVPADLVGQTQNGHYGLAGMKERAEAVGGTLTVTSEPGKGTTILVTVDIGRGGKR